MGKYEGLIIALVEGDEVGAANQTKELMARGILALDILNHGLTSALSIVGDQLEKGEIFLPEMLSSSEAAKAVLKILQPNLARRGGKKARLAVIGTVKDDLHDIGKSIASMVFKGYGYEVTDLGIDVSAEQFVLSVRNNKPDVLGMSSLLTPTMLNMKCVIELLDAENLRKELKIVVGGAPVTQDFADEIGADVYAENAVGGVKQINRLLDSQD